MSAPIPAWVDDWCAANLGARVEERLFDAGQMSDVVGIRLRDGRAVVVKARPSEGGRAAACVEVQRAAAAVGLPCAAPLTNAVEERGLTVHAEEWRPGGSMRAETPGASVASA